MVLGRLRLELSWLEVDSAGVDFVFVCRRNLEGANNEKKIQGRIIFKSKQAGKPQNRKNKNHNHRKVLNPIFSSLVQLILKIVSLPLKLVYFFLEVFGYFLDVQLVLLI